MAHNKGLAGLVGVEFDGRLGSDLDDVKSIAPEERLETSLMVQIRDGCPEETLLHGRDGGGAIESGYMLESCLRHWTCQCWHGIGDEVYFETIQWCRGLIKQPMKKARREAVCVSETCNKNSIHRILFP